jgi:hypothetical protein
MRGKSFQECLGGNRLALGNFNVMRGRLFSHDASVLWSP